MHKIQSNKLYKYLLDRGVLELSPAEILVAKKNYRREYKNDFARQKRKNQREIRFHLTKDEFRQIQSVCDKEHNVSPTALAKDLLLSAGLSRVFIPNQKRLNVVLKQLGIAINLIHSGKSNSAVRTKLLQAETELLDYLKLLK